MDHNPKSKCWFAGREFDTPTEAVQYAKLFATAKLALHAIEELPHLDCYKQQRLEIRPFLTAHNPKYDRVEVVFHVYTTGRHQFIGSFYANALTDLSPEAI